MEDLFEQITGSEMGVKRYKRRRSKISADNEEFKSYALKEAMGVSSVYYPRDYIDAEHEFFSRDHFLEEESFGSGEMEARGVDRAQLEED